MLLKLLIENLLGGSTPPDLVRDFVYHCHHLAGAYLRRKVTGGRLHLNTFNLTLDDLALDCIADLFERDAQHSFPKLQGFYSSLNVASMEEEACLAVTRQLVFSEVNRHLFRLYRENDPALGKIIRNLKNAVKAIDDVSVERRGDELWLYVLGESHRGRSLPVISPETLEIHLADRVSQSTCLKATLLAFRDVIVAETSHARRFPLVGLALIVRSISSRAHGAEPAWSEPEEESGAEDIRMLVRESVEAVHDRLYDSYVGRQKLDHPDYEALFEAVQNILEAQYVHNDGVECSLYEFLRRSLPFLTPSAYQQRFRVYLEYFNKLSRRELLDAARKELS
jgi:hypothetical protein